MHRISERLFQAKKDLEMCEKSLVFLKDRLKELQEAGCERVAKAVDAEIEYFQLRAESAKAMIAVETVGEW